MPEGRKRMESTRSEMLPRLDFSKITFSKEPLATEEALEDIIPIEWSGDVLSGERKIVLTASGGEQKR